MVQLFGADLSTNTPILQNMMGTLSGGKGIHVLDPTLEKVKKVGVSQGRENVEATWWNVVSVDMEAVKDNKELDEEWEDGAELGKVDWILEMAQGGK